MHFTLMLDNKSRWIFIGKMHQGFKGKSHLNDDVILKMRRNVVYNVTHINKCINTLHIEYSNVATLSIAVYKNAISTDLSVNNAQTNCI